MGSTEERTKGCECHQEEGDSPCPVHGFDEGGIDTDFATPVDPTEGEPDPNAEPFDAGSPEPSAWDAAQKIAVNLAAQPGGKLALLTVEIMKVQQLESIFVALQDLRLELADFTHEGHSFATITRAIDDVASK